MASKKNLKIIKEMPKAKFIISCASSFCFATG
jgi:hypothetical protein